MTVRRHLERHYAALVVIVLRVDLKDNPFSAKKHDVGESESEIWGYYVHPLRALFTRTFLSA